VQVTVKNGFLNQCTIHMKESTNDTMVLNYM
jgi:hypothetical protein